MRRRTGSSETAEQRLLGKDWPKAFCLRHPELEAARRKAIDSERHEKNIRAKVQSWFEIMGKQRIYAALGDAWILAEFPRTFVASANTFIIVLCSVGYMFTINVAVALTFTFFLTALSIGFIKSGITIKDEFAIIQGLQDKFYAYMNDFLDGIKEVKMRATRSDSILSDYIAENRQKKKVVSIKTYTKDTVFGFVSRFTWYLLIGSIVFIFPRFFHLTVASMTVCLLIVLNIKSKCLDADAAVAHLAIAIRANIFDFVIY